MSDLIDGILLGADAQIREPLKDYMQMLVNAGVDADLLSVCATEFIKAQIEGPDRRYSGC